MAEEKKKSEYLVEVKDLKEYFPVKTGFFQTVPLKAVDGVSFNIKHSDWLVSPAAERQPSAAPCFICTSRRAASSILTENW